MRIIEAAYLAAAHLLAYSAGAVQDARTVYRHWAKARKIDTPTTEQEK